jgi:hypothetical protein
MNANIKKTLISGLVALTAIGTLATVPAQAKPIPKPFPHPHHGHFGWGAAGLFTGLALGAMAASAAPTYTCGTVREAVVNRHGEIIGYRYVPTC